MKVEYHFAFLTEKETEHLTFKKKKKKEPVVIDRVLNGYKFIGAAVHLRGIIEYIIYSTR